MSIHSPPKYKPSVFLDSNVLGFSSCVFTPPRITSALSYPLSPAGITSKVCSHFANSLSFFFPREAIFISIGKIPAIASKKRFVKKGFTSCLSVLLPPAFRSSWINVEISCFGSRFIYIFSPARQYEDICKIAGPLNPQCVNKIFSSNSILSLYTRQKTELPDKAAYHSASLPVMVNGTRAGAVGTMVCPNCLATCKAKSDAPIFATGNPPVVRISFSACTDCFFPSLYTKTSHPFSVFYTFSALL